MQPILELIGTILLLASCDKRSFLVFNFTSRAKPMTMSVIEKSLMVLAGIVPGSYTLSDQCPKQTITSQESSYISGKQIISNNGKRNYIW